jgi:tetratricopeptide (TPR) repeat protein
MRTVLGSLFLLALLPLAASAQTQTPSWPDIHFNTCPQIVAPISPSQRTWKHEQSEQAEYAAAMQMLQAKNYNDAAQGFAKFADEFPDSDYRETALIGAMASMQKVKDVNGQVRTAKMLIELPTAQAMTRVASYVALDTYLSPYIVTTDPEKTRKTSDLEKWTRCGIEALDALVPPENMQPDPLKKNREASEFMFDRTQGYVHFLREDYSAAVPWLEKAAQLNSQDALAYLWLGRAKLLSPSPDFNGGIFYLAKWAELVPQVSGAPDYLKQSYVIVHGSDEGIENLRAIAKTNTTPPPGFDVLAPTIANRSSSTQVGNGHHYAGTVAAAALIGLLAYGAAKCPDCLADVFGAQSPAKVMLFGGPGHHTYLGCLSCSLDAPDSLFNDSGKNGSRGSADSIWNHSGEYGSPYSQFSACDPYGTDPPVIVDQNGNAYGRATVNQYATDIGAGAKLYAWLVSAVCAN